MSLHSSIVDGVVSGGPFLETVWQGQFSLIMFTPFVTVLLSRLSLQGKVIRNVMPITALQ